MRVAAAQFKARKGEHDASLRALVSLAEVASQDADVLVLPEMAVSGYLFASTEAAREVAEPPRGPTYQALGKVARDSACWVVCGFPELDRERVFNSAMVVDPAGELRFVYRKTLLYRADVPWATPGDSGYRRFDTESGSFGVGICMDLNDDRFIEWCTKQDLSALALPTNWVEEGEDVWGYWAWRMHGLDAALVAANTYGTETLGDVVTAFSGGSAVIRRRTLLAAAPKTGDGHIHAVLD